MLYRNKKYLVIAGLSQVLVPGCGHIVLAPATLCGTATRLHACSKSGQVPAALLHMGPAGSVTRPPARYPVPLWQRRAVSCASDASYDGWKNARDGRSTYILPEPRADSHPSPVRRAVAGQVVMQSLKRLGMPQESRGA